MLSKMEWETRVEKLNNGLLDLYWNKGKLSLRELNDFKSVVQDINETMQTLFKKEAYALPKKAFTIRKEKAQLNNIFQSLEMGLLTAA